MKLPMPSRNLSGWLALFFTGVAGVACAAGVTGSKHDLSDMGSGSGASEEICVFCHTPHNASTQVGAPLWNRRITDINAFKRYSSNSMGTVTSTRPNGVSLACLSCHDAIKNQGEPSAVHGLDQHSVLNPPADGKSARCSACHPRAGYEDQPWRTGPDLSNDHPISMQYPTAAQDPYFNIPPNLNDGWSDIRLFKGKVECPTCHNAHDQTNTMFLRKSNASSALCLTCHNK